MSKTSSIGSFGVQNRRSFQNPGQIRRNTAVVPRVDTSKWLDDDFAGVKLKNFDEMRENFIENLTNQFSDLLVPNSTSTRYNSVKLNQTTNALMTDPDEENKTGHGDQ